ncbi:MAG: DMT family transporter [Clostridia bacterium]
MKNKRIQSNIMLVITALIWGVSFVAQSIGMKHVGPFTFNAVRCILGGLVLIPCIALMDRSKAKSVTVGAAAPIAAPKSVWLGGIMCGLALFVASSLQQVGIQYTTVGKAGFITALYIVIVPLLGLFFKKKVPLTVWTAVAIATGGMYLLCVTKGFDIGKGDILMLLCAVCFSVHILVIDHFSPHVDCVRMSCIQFFVCGFVSLIPMFLLENPEIKQILAAWMPILYSGVLSCGVAYTLQVVAQKNTAPAVASLILSLESVFSVLAGWLLLGQTLSAREILGCVLVFAAIILAQLPSGKKILK